MKKTATAMERLLSEGFFENRETALPYLMSGAVYCGAQRVTTGGQRLPLDKPLSVHGLDSRYLSKGGYKLEGAIRDFGIDVTDRVCIDAGACTGGFTDCLIKHGAALVYAVEVGFGQLAGALAQDPRVVNLERTNLGDAKLLSLNPVPTLGSVDLSYLSLVKAVPQYRAIMRGEGELLCLVKPLFETDDPAARRTGMIDPSTFPALLRHLCDALDSQPLTHAVAVTHSPVTGNNGTHEFFVHVRFSEAPQPCVTDEAIARAVERVLELKKYHKSL